MYKAVTISLLLALFAVASATRIASVQRHHLRHSVRATAVTIAQADIDAMVSAHNSIRNEVAGGNVHGKDGAALPKAADMVELAWNADVAAHAQAYANSLISMLHSVEDARAKVGGFIYVGENIFEYPHNATEGLGNWTKAVDYWFRSAANFPKDEVSALFSSDAAEFTQIAWSLTAFIGCGAATYPNGTDSAAVVVVCQYGPGGNVAGSPVYTAGAPQSKCKFGKSTKYPNLCATGKPSDNTGKGTPAAAPSTEADLPPVGPAPVGPVGPAPANGTVVNTTTNTTAKVDGGASTTTTTTTTEVEDGAAVEGEGEGVEGETEALEGEGEAAVDGAANTTTTTTTEVEGEGEAAVGEGEEAVEGETEAAEGEGEEAVEGAVEGEGETGAEVDGGAEAEAGAEVDGETAKPLEEVAPGDAEAGIDSLETDAGEGENGDSTKGLGDGEADEADSLATEAEGETAAGAEEGAEVAGETEAGADVGAEVEANAAVEADAEAARITDAEISSIKRIGEQIKPMTRSFKDATYFRNGLAKVMDRKH